MRRAASGLYRPSEQGVASRIAYGVLILIAMGIVATGVYIWRQHEINQLHDQLSQQTSQIASLQADLATLKAGAQPTPPITTRYTSLRGVTMQVFAPLEDTKVASPVAVIGDVPGNWSFEASFPIKLLDQNGKVIAQTSAQLLGNWMTDQPVPFSAKLTYDTSPQVGSGTLVLQKDNPSGLASNDDSIAIPVKL